MNKVRGKTLAVRLGNIKLAHFGAVPCIKETAPRGAIQEVLLMAELQKYKLTSSAEPGKDVQLIYLSYAGLNAALIGKQIDAMMQSEPQASQAINKGSGSKCRNPTAPRSAAAWRCRWAWRWAPGRRCMRG